MTATDTSSFIVVGAGVFGASTAYHLIRKYPSARVVLIDRTPYPSQVGASWDLNKVIRADYASLLYMEKALEALQLWRHDQLFKEFYHQSGLVWLDNAGLPQTIIDNYVKLKADEKYRLSHSEELKGLYDGIHRDADYTGVTNILINESSGWGEASKAVTKLIESAVAAGVKYVTATIESLQFDGKGACTGVRTTGNEILSATHIVLATGAYTAKLLADSAPHRAELQSGDRIIAAALVTGTVKLDPRQAERFKRGPVFIQDVGNLQGGSLPPNSDNELKFWQEASFMNTVKHSASGQLISMPPNEPDYAQWNVSQKLKDEVLLLNQRIFGAEGHDFEIGNYRVCWDAITPTQDWIICEHPHCKNLYIATGGSFHSWKFLPVLGKYVVQALNRTLDAELVKMWAWDRDGKGSAHEGMFPEREMKDLY